MKREREAREALATLVAMVGYSDYEGKRRDESIVLDALDVAEARCRALEYALMGLMLALGSGGNADDFYEEVNQKVAEARETLAYARKLRYTMRRKP